jgi:hypothetical protein
LNRVSYGFTAVQSRKTIKSEDRKKEIYLVKANGDVISKQQEGFFGLTSWDAKIRNCLKTR